MNNTNDHLTFQDQGMHNGLVKLTSCEKGALFLDMRTILEPLIMGNDGWRDAKMQLCKFYVEFYVQCKACERKKKMDELARRATENNGQATVPTSLEPDAEEADVVVMQSMKIDILDSESEDEDHIPGTDEITEEERQRLDSEGGKLEFAKVIREWMRYSKEIKWTTLYAELTKDQVLDLVD